MVLPVRWAVFVVACFSVSTVASDKPVPLADQQLDMDLLANLGETTFHLRLYLQSEVHGESGRRVDIRVKDGGSYRMKTALKPNTVVLDDKIRISKGDSSFTRIFTCDRNSTLSTQAFSLQQQRGSHLELISMVVEEGEASTTLPTGAKRSVVFPEDAVTMNAMLRIATLLPREPGRAWSVPSLIELGTLGVVRPVGQPSIVITCLGPRNIEVGGESYRCTRYDVTTGQKIRDFSIWVDDAGQLQQVMFGLDVRMTRRAMLPVEDGDPFLEMIEQSLNRR